MKDSEQVMPEESSLDCFVIMPISDAEGYEPGHFKRVYNYLIKPACLQAGFNPVRADDVYQTNDIVLDVLRKIHDSPMALADLSSRNPNVFYELGIRQAFNLPVTILKDLRTTRAFDIQGIRDIGYDASLRIDYIEETVDQIASTLRNTYESKSKKNGNQINSIIDLLGVKKAEVDHTTTISPDTQLLLGAIQQMGKRLDNIENRNPEQRSRIGIGPPPIRSRSSADLLELQRSLIGKYIIDPNKGRGEIKAFNFGDQMYLVQFPMDGRYHAYTYIDALALLEDSLEA